MKTRGYVRARTSARVVVVGGGVVGVTTAVALARRGLTVTLLERAQTLGAGATARNGGQLSYCYVDALGIPSLIRQLPTMVAGLDPAFRVHASLSPSFLRWTFRFLANCTTRKFIDNTKAVLRLALRSRSALTALRASHPSLTFNYAAAGKLSIYDAAEGFKQATSVIPLKNAFGCNQRALTIDELLAIEPALSECKRKIVGAIYSPIDEAGDSHLFTQALAGLAQREYGLTVLTSTAAHEFVAEKRRICAVGTPHGFVEGDLFVLTAGSYSSALARTAGLRLPIYPMKGYSITLPAVSSSPTVSVTDAGARIVFCRLGDRIRIAGMAELGCAGGDADSHRIALLTNAARACLPVAADWRADPHSWSGVRPVTPDCRPIIGATPIPNLFLNCGHGMLGWTLACGSAELTASLMLDECPTQADLAMADDFSFARF